MSNVFNTFDIDGVIFMGKEMGGVYPHPDDIIITGRSFEEEPETIRMLESKGIRNKVFFNSRKFEEKCRESSGEHKARTIRELINSGNKINIHFEDDPIQAAVIEREVPEVNVVLLVHNLIEKENVRHEF